MIEPDHSGLSIVQQCALVSINRPASYYRPTGESPLNLALMRLIDEAVMDWATRKVLSWRISNTMEADFCIEALEEPLTAFGRPTCASAWTGEAAGWTTSSSNACGGP